MFCFMLLYVHSSIAIILMGKRELIALLNLSSWCLVVVERLFLVVPRGCLQFVIVVFPAHTHLLFSTGPDSIPANILKAAADKLIPILTILYQTSLNSGEVPSDWKDAWIVPVFKKGDKHKPANYRPVSLTSITCKLLEHIVHSHVMPHFD